MQKSMNVEGRYLYANLTKFTLEDLMDKKRRRKKGKKNNTERIPWRQIK